LTVTRGVSGLSGVAIWLASPRKVRTVAGQLHRAHAGTTSSQGKLQ
jgi:hypothetical protein